MSLSITLAVLAFTMQIRSLVELYTTMGRTIKERFKAHHIILLVVAMVSSLLLSLYMIYSFDNTVLATMAILLMWVFNIGGDSRFKDVTNETNNQEVLLLTRTWFAGTIIIYTLFLILNIGYYFI